jgi:hypothetical protein
MIFFFFLVTRLRPMYGPIAIETICIGYQNSLNKHHEIVFEFFFNVGLWSRCGLVVTETI